MEEKEEGGGGGGGECVCGVVVPGDFTRILERYLGE